MGIDHGLLNYYHFFSFLFFFFHFFFQIFKGKQLWRFSICLQDDKFHPKQGLRLKNKNLLLYFIATEKLRIVIGQWVPRNCTHWHMTMRNHDKTGFMAYDSDRPASALRTECFINSSYFRLLGFHGLLILW